jgi:hypothetical protein
MKNNIVCAENYWPHIPDGAYEAQCIKYDSSFQLGKTRKVFLHFRIVEPGSNFQKQIFMAFNLPDKKKIRTGSKYYKTWCMVNGWKRPSKNAKMSPRIFKNKIYKIKTRTVRPKHHGKEMPEEFWYSVVDEIVEVVVGEVVAGSDGK